VRLVSFNIQHGLAVGGSGADPTAYAEAIRELDADVLGLQEVDLGQPRSGGVDQAQRAADAMGAVDVRFAPTLVGMPGGSWRAVTADGRGPAGPSGRNAEDESRAAGEPRYGLALATRYRVRSWHRLDLPAARGRWPVAVPGRRVPVPIVDEPRVVLAAVLEVPGGVMTVATTHLSFVPGWNVWQLRRAIRFLRPLPAPRVLLGDLNIPAVIAKHLGDWSPLVTTPTYPSHEPKIQFDHALGHGGVPAVTGYATPRLPISDHRALVIDIADRPDMLH
jgi:endonuclease/exonuclease/phosphatase family metal-dependent hydrolase